jgi:predicted transcriptional regulator
MTQTDDVTRIEITTQIVAAYVANNNVTPGHVIELLHAVHASIEELSGSKEPTEQENAVPAVSIRKSVTDDHIVCLEDGKVFKSLRRHLKSSHDMTPDVYRQKWNLPSDYPMVAPNYAAKRSNLAKSFGLGKRENGS